MDKATIGGLASGAALLVISVLIAPGAKFSAFWDTASAAVVVGGAIAATAIAFPVVALLKFPKVLKKTIQPNSLEAGPVISELVALAEVARKDGILALEQKTEDIDDPFILLGIQMAVDGIDSELMEDLLRTEVNSVAERHKAGKQMFDAVGRYAPAFGMIGTLMGLIIMLGNMDDPDAIGPGMAVALITTLYGAIVANLIFLPLADKLAFYSKREMEIREIIVRGILSIQQGDNPRVVEQKLKTCLPADQRGGEEMAKAA